MVKVKADALDYDPSIQQQFASAAAVSFPQEVVKDSAFINWNEVEQSSGANREWFWNVLMLPVAFFSNFLEVQVHPGWVGKVSRMGALVQNPGSNKDAAVDMVAGARSLQTSRRKLDLLDEFSMPFFYQAMKSNDYRMLVTYKELDTLLQKCMQSGSGQVVDAKTRMVRIYDCRHWGYGIKSETVSSVMIWRRFHGPSLLPTMPFNRKSGMGICGRIRSVALGSAGLLAAHCQ